MTESTDSESEFFYAREGEQLGPVGKKDLFSLVETGEVSLETLIWIDGEKDWIPFQGKFPDFAQGRVRCAYSGELRDPEEMLEYGDDWVAPEYKEAFVQKLAEGSDTEGSLENGFVPSLSLWSIWRQSWCIWKANLLPISIVTIVIWIPLCLLLEYLDYNVWSEMYAEDEVQALSQYFRMERTLETWIGSIATGAVICLAAHVWRGGHAMTVGETFSGGFSNYGRLLGTRIISGFALFFVILIGALPVILIEFLPFQIGWATIAAVAICYLVVRFGFVDYFAISEQAGGFPAFTESWKATGGQFWRIVGFQTAVWTVVALIGIVLTLPLLYPPLDNFVLSAFLSTLASVAVSFGIVETLVLALHLKAHRPPDAIVSPERDHNDPSDSISSTED